MKVVKTIEEQITLEMLDSLIGKFVHVPVNVHTIADELQGSEEHNVWFGGMVAGYERGVVAFDFSTGEFSDTPATHYNLLLTNGNAMSLSLTKCEIKEVTQEEFEVLVAEFQAKQAAQKVLQLPGRDF